MKLKYYIILFCLAFGFISLKAENNDSTKIASASVPFEQQKGFTWGIDMGSSIDLSSNGMSTIDGDAYFGFKNNFFRIIGVGASIHSPLGGNNSFIPVYAILRTNFRNKPSLCFLDLRGGVSFNSLGKDNDQTGAFASCGIGFNLYCNTKFKSHIILAYSFFKLDNYTKNDLLIDADNLNAMSVRIGISF